MLINMITKRLFSTGSIGNSGNYLYIKKSNMYINIKKRRHATSNVKRMLYIYYNKSKYVYIYAHTHTYVYKYQ